MEIFQKSLSVFERRQRFIYLHAEMIASVKVVVMMISL